MGILRLRCYKSRPRVAWIVFFFAVVVESLLGRFFLLWVPVHSGDCDNILIFAWYIRSVDLRSWLLYFLFATGEWLMCCRSSFGGFNVFVIMKSVASVTTVTVHLKSSPMFLDWSPTRLKRLCVLHAMFKERSCFQSVDVGWFTRCWFLFFWLKASHMKGVAYLMNMLCQ